MGEKNILGRLGPGLITAAVVLGPGSIIASSRAGAEAGYGLVWVLVIAGVFMATYTAMGARLGCALDQTPLGYVAQRWGRPASTIVGLSGFLVAGGFQFGNNLGVALAMEGLLPMVPGPVWPILFTTLATAFLFLAKDLYKLLERAMLVMVAAMLIAFSLNLVRVGFSPVELGKGLVPRVPAEGNDVIARAMLATTFSAVAAFYQAYLVRAKGWTKDTVGDAIRDAWLGITILGGIALVIMIGAAETLHGTGSSFGNVGDLARQLEGTLGGAGVIVFSLGVAAASFSSFITNSCIGGALMADGLGQGETIDSRGARIWTVVGLVVGCIVAVISMTGGGATTTSLLIAQASTLIAAPICALLIFGLTSSKGLMGEGRNGYGVMAIGGVGLLVIGWLMTGTVRGLVGKLGELF